MESPHPVVVCASNSSWPKQRQKSTKTNVVIGGQGRAGSWGGGRKRRQKRVRDLRQDPALLLFQIKPRCLYAGIERREECRVEGEIYLLAARRQNNKTKAGGGRCEASRGARVGDGGTETDGRDAGRGPRAQKRRKPDRNARTNARRVKAYPGRGAYLRRASSH
ncbi:hypothetical protein KM043_013691 [Ampulex compressa]|nr:hypothetical protein KM043_013691 [Ampulex compressa]